ncbi:MAG: type III-A CRISPR-associated protein Csm2 [Clostridium sp.]|nr:type III-A CRISPR-associated protein Csm2 [Clostridium sp.]
MSYIQNRKKIDLKNNDIRKIESYFKNIILKIPNDPEEYDEYIKEIKNYAEHLRDKGVTTSQIRKVYSQVMNSNNVMELKKLRPKLAYIVGKNEKNGALRNFIDVLDTGINKLNNNEPENKELNNFKEFLETIVAYRKYVGNDK